MEGGKNLVMVPCYRSGMKEICDLRHLNLILKRKLTETNTEQSGLFGTWWYIAGCDNKITHYGKVIGSGVSERVWHFTLWNLLSLIFWSLNMKFTLWKSSTHLLSIFVLGHRHTLQMASNILRDRSGLFWKMVWGAFKHVVKFFHCLEQMWQSVPQYAGACQDIPPSKTDIHLLPLTSLHPSTTSEGWAEREVQRQRYKFCILFLILILGRLYYWSKT